MNKNLTFTGVMAIVALLVGFGAGYFAPHGGSQPRGQFGAGNQAGGNGAYQIRVGAGGKLANGNAVGGTIISKDSTSITVQLGGPNASSTNGTASGSKIVLYDSSTQVGEYTTGSTNDLKVGQDVVVSGTPNSDGSLTAQMIQVRPAGMGPRIGG